MHPYNRILTDCLTIIFDYHIQKAHQDVHLYSREDLRFFTRCIKCWSFDEDVNVKHFLERTRGSKCTLLYVRAIANRTLDSETFQYFRGIHELNIEHWGAHVPQYSDDDFANLRGIHTLDIYRNWRLTDAAFVHLRGIHTLNMAECRSISDEAFVNLRGIHTLNMNYCRQITDAALVNLRGINTLHMSECEGISNEGLENLRGIHSLDISYTKISGAGLVHLRGIDTLKANQCTDITDDDLVNLRGIVTLSMHGCEVLTNAGLINLRGIHCLSMDIENCKINDTGFDNLRGIVETALHLDYISNAGLENFRGAVNLTLERGDSAHSIGLKNLYGVKELYLFRSALTGEGFEHLCRVEKLTLDHCDFISGEAFLHLRALKHLSLFDVYQDTIRDEHFENLNTLEVLHMSGYSQRPLPGFTGKALKHLKSLKELHTDGIQWNLDNEFVLNIPQDMEDVSLDNCTISCANLHVFCGTKEIRVPQILVNQEDVEYAKQCLKCANVIVAQISGSGAPELIEYLCSRGCMIGNHDSEW